MSDSEVISESNTSAIGRSFVLGPIEGHMSIKIHRTSPACYGAAGDCTCYRCKYEGWLKAITLFKLHQEF